ncbi:metallophosphoesterase [Vibrio fortis]|uniref:metallophosphoesterase n=1 Tax=Vibrio fortis TaxID=212667 RepID=UPI004068270A
MHLTDETKSTLDVYLASDIHNELLNEYAEPEKHYYVPKATSAIPNAFNLLLLAGDNFRVNAKYSTKVFLNLVSKQFDAVVIVLGNHEFYLGKLFYSVEKLKSYITDLGLKNVRVIENESQKISFNGFEVGVLGGTLWGDFLSGDATSLRNSDTNRYDKDFVTDLLRIRRNMRDFGNYGRIKPKDLFYMNRQAVNYISKSISTIVSESDFSILMTHFPPLRLEDPSSKFYGYDSTDLKDVILDAQPNLVVFGHDHQSHSGLVGDSIYISNPKGYLGDLNPDFSEKPIYRLELPKIAELACCRGIST